jgi:hypothetical protein
MVGSRSTDSLPVAMRAGLESENLSWTVPPGGAVSLETTTDAGVVIAPSRKRARLKCIGMTRRTR